MKNYNFKFWTSNKLFFYIVVLPNKLGHDSEMLKQQHCWVVAKGSRRAKRGAGSDDSDNSDDSDGFVSFFMSANTPPVGCNPRDGPSNPNLQIIIIGNITKKFGNIMHLSVTSS